VKTKPLFVLSSLAGGGAERVAVNLMRKLDRSRFSPSLAVFEKKGPYFADLPDDVVVYDLRKKSKLDWPRAILRLAHILRDQRHDVIVSFDWHANVVSLAAAGLARTGTKVVAAVRIHESAAIERKPELQGLRGIVRRLVVRLAFRHAACVMANSKEAEEDLAANFRIPRERLRTLHNPLDIAHIEAMANKPIDEHWFPTTKPLVLAMGRLAPQKGFSCLLRAFAQVREEVPCTLAILGEGPEEGMLQTLARELELGEELVLPGFQENPYKFMRRADVFALSSLYEGFPNVVLEAMACGASVVATRCPSGPEEIIDHGENGLLVEVDDESELAEAILSVLRDPSLCAKLQANAKARAQQFSVDRIVPQFEDLLQTLAPLALD